MTEFLQWTAVLELVGLAFVPLTFWLCRSLPDRGYAFSKVLGLVLVTYAVWLIGNALPVAASPLLPIVILLGGAGLCWWLWRRDTVSELWERRWTVLMEEALFLAALVCWSLLRAHAFHPDINHTEQYMDLSLLGASLRSGSFPPYDPWMSGHSMNYYYFGYLMFAEVIKTSGVSAAVGYNLSLSSLFALTVAGSFSIGYALTRRWLWASLAPLFVALIGNWHRVLWQIPHSPCPGASGSPFWAYFWDSTRVVGGHFTLGDWSHPTCGGPTSDYTINEFPLFSFILGDLHPHVMALPVTLLAMALACAIVFAPQPFRLVREPGASARLVLTAVCVGVLFMINSWDYPTYLLLVVIAVVVNAYITIPSRTWWRTPLRSVPALCLLSAISIAPFYLHFRSLAHGIGLVHTRTDIFEFIQVFGLFLLACGLLVASLGLLLQPATDEAADADEAAPVQPVAASREAGQSQADTGLILLVVGLLAVVALSAALHIWVLLLIVALGIWALAQLRRVTNTEDPNRADAVALILIVTACIVLALTEVIYLRDSFDGGSNYRMNTVFKFYYQAWSLLGLAAAYGAYRALRVLRDLYGSGVAWSAALALAVGVAGSASYTVLIPTSAPEGSAVESLDGMAWLRTQHPDDFSAISWIQRHASGNPVVVEASRDAYNADFSRVSTFTGLPTVLGWPDHENQWRNNDPEVAVRQAAVQRIYTLPDASAVERLLKTYHVRYVFLGDTERTTYGAAAALHPAFARFMRVAYQSGSTRIYTW